MAETKEKFLNMEFPFVCSGFHEHASGIMWGKGCKGPLQTRPRRKNQRYTWRIHLLLPKPFADRKENEQ